MQSLDGDRAGNLTFHKATRNFNPLCAMAGKITIAEVERLVEPGDIDPEDVHLPGIYVQRMVKVPPPPDGWWPQRPAEVAKAEAERSAR